MVGYNLEMEIECEIVSLKVEGAQRNKFNHYSIQI